MGAQADALEDVARSRRRREEQQVDILGERARRESQRGVLFRERALVVARDDVARLRRFRKLSTSRRSDTSIRRILEQGWLLEVTRAPVLEARAFPLKNCPNS